MSACKHTLWLELPLLKNGSRQCIFTGKEISKQMLETNAVNRDHVVPKSKGGNNTRNNIVLCKKEFNQNKSDQSLKQCVSKKKQREAILKRVLSSNMPPDKQFHIIRELI